MFKVLLRWLSHFGFMLSGLAVGLVALAVIIGIYISLNGLRLHGLAQLVSTQLSELLPEYRITMRDARLEWLSWQAPMVLAADKVEIRDKENHQLAKIELIQAKVKIIDLLEGKLDITQLILTQPLIDTREWGDKPNNLPSIDPAIDLQAIPINPETESPAANLPAAAVPPALLSLFASQSFLDIYHPDFQNGNLLSSQWHEKILTLINQYQLGKLQSFAIHNGKIITAENLDGISLDMRLTQSAKQDLTLFLDVNHLAQLTLSIPNPQSLETIAKLTLHSQELNASDLERFGVQRLPKDLLPWLPKQGKIILDTEVLIDRQGFPLSASATLSLSDAINTPLFTNLQLKGQFQQGLKAALWDYQLDKLAPKQFSELLRAGFPQQNPIGDGDLWVLDGEIQAKGQAEFQGDELANLKLNLYSDEVTLSLPSLGLNNQTFTPFKTEWEWNAAEHTLSLTDLTAGLMLGVKEDNRPKPPLAQIHASGSIKLGDPKSHIELTAILTDYEMAQLARHWPKSLAKEAREWVTQNISKGKVPKATFNFEGDWGLEPKNDKPSLTLSKLNGEINLRDAVVDYLSPLPKATNVQANARYDDDGFSIEIVKGDVGKQIRVTRGKIDISGLKLEKEAIAIKLTTEGDMGAALSLLEKPPYNYLSGYGIAAQDVSGVITQAQLNFNFPLSVAIKESDIRYDVKARAKTIVWQRPNKGLTHKLPQLDLTLNNSHFLLNGGLALDSGNLAQFTYQENALPNKTSEQNLTYQGELPADWINSFVDLSTLSLQGSMKNAIIDYTIGANKQPRLSLNADLAGFGWSLPDYPLKKAPNDAGQFNVTVTAIPTKSGDNYQQISLNGINYQQISLNNSDKPVIQGNLTLTQGPVKDKFNNPIWDVQAIDLNRLKLGKTDLSLLHYQPWEDGYQLAIEGQALDATLLDKSDKSKPDNPNKPALQAAIKLKKLWLEANKSLEDVSLSFQERRGSYTDFDLKAKGLTAKITSPLSHKNFDSQKSIPDSGIRHFSANGNDANLLLIASGANAIVEGGKFQLEADKAGFALPYKGRLLVDKFVVKEAPSLVKLIQLMSITGLGDALTSNDLNFTSLDGDYQFQNNVISFENIRAVGNSVGMTVNGTVDLDKRRLNLNGLVIPAYALSSLIGSIPLIGQIVSGVNNDGILASGYSIKGSFDNPDISSQPSNLLAPGILRDIFTGIGNALP